MGKTGKKRLRRGTRKRSSRPARYWKIIVLAASAAIILMAGYRLYRIQPFPSLRSLISGSLGPERGRGEMTVQLFFASSEFDPQGLDCSKVYPVDRRIHRTDAVARAAVEALLVGPTTDEQSRGYYTSLDPNIELRGVEINRQGEADVDFGPALDRDLAGSCRVQSAEAQIRQTLLQFPTVHTVRITAEKQDASPLQP